MDHRIRQNFSCIAHVHNKISKSVPGTYRNWYTQGYIYIHAQLINERQTNLVND